MTLAEQLIGKGLQLAIYDPEVRLSHLLGANRRYIERHLPHIGQLIRSDIETVIAKVGAAGRRAGECGRSWRRSRATCGLISCCSTRATYRIRSAVAARVEGLCW